MKITKLIKHKYKKNFISIYMDGKFYICLPDEAVYKLGIKEADEYDKEKFDHLIKKEEKTIAMDSAFRLLSVRSRSKKEIESRLKLKKHTEGTITKVTDRLNEMGYIDDKKFALNWANYRKGQNKGEELIKSELFLKGVSSAIIQAVLSSLYHSKEEEQEHITEIILKRLNKTKDGNKKDSYRKLLGFMARRGFSIDKVSTALRNIRKDFEETG